MTVIVLGAVHLVCDDMVLNTLRDMVASDVMQVCW